MAEKYIINMPLKSTPDDTDLMIIEDAQDTKRITWANVVKPIKDLVDNITESGSNVNGSYIKFDDGTMICHMPYQQPPTFADFLNLEMTYPATFSGSSMISGMFAMVAGSSDEATLIHYAKAFVNTRSTYCTLNMPNPTTDAPARGVSIKIIGRWK